MGPVLQAFQVDHREKLADAIDQFVERLSQGVMDGSIPPGRNGKVTVYVLGRYNADRQYVPGRKGRFGEPDIDLISEKDGRLRVKVNGVDVFEPQTGEVISGGADGIACWFIDTDYNEESFFVRHAYFLGANDPYSALKTTLKAEIDPKRGRHYIATFSRPFNKPKKGRIAVKVINHLGDEVMKVFKFN